MAGCLGSSLQAVRCAAAECLGRLAQVVSEPQFVASVLQLLFDNLKSARDAVSRTGHSFALGCLHRHAGGMGAPSVQHRHTSVSILLALARDVASPVVQKWSLHALVSLQIRMDTFRFENPANFASEIFTPARRPSPRPEVPCSGILWSPPCQPW